MAEKLSAEIMDAYQKQGGAYKRKEEVHTQGADNASNSSYRWK